MPSVYPHLEYLSLLKRCNEDNEQFIKNPNHKGAKFIYELYNPKKDDTKDLLHDKIKPLLDFFTTHLDDKDYVSEISHMQPELQKQLWIARTYLFYQLLIYATAAMKFESIYDRICFELFRYGNNRSIFSFRLDISRILHLINLGIFGSLNATSDIDVGISAGFDTTTMTKPIMPYIVCVIEHMFFIFTGKSSLKWDIEVYGDLLTLPNTNPVTKNTNPDIFYLDTSQFTQEHFKQILQPVISGMLRNILLGYIDHGKTVEEAAEQITESSLLNLLEKNKALLQSLNSGNKNIEGKLNKLITIIEYLLIYKDVFVDSTMFTSAKTEAVSFLSKAYDTKTKDSLLGYYTRLYDAEETQMKLLKEKSNKLEVDDIAQILSLYEQAAVWKMENYISAPTVEHVVRILQASKKNLPKYATTTPAEYCANRQKTTEPYCIIGKYGYIISILEQIGYIIRFNNMYCIGNHQNVNKCKKKLGKYMDRVDDGIKRLQDISKNEQQSRLQAISKNTQSLKNVISSTRLPNPVKPTINPSKKIRLLELALANKNKGGRRYTKRRSPKKAKTQKKRRH